MFDLVWYFLLFVYTLCCIGLIVIVLLQKGKGSGFGGAFGGTGSDTIFGPKSGKTLPQRLTYVFAGVFMTIAFIMSLMAGHLTRGQAPEKVDVTAAGNAKTDSGAPQVAVVPGLEDLGSAITGGPSTAPTSAPAAPASAPAAPATPAPAPATPAAPAAPAPASN